MKQRTVPLGYRIENGNTVIHEAEVDTVREIARQYLGGKSLKAIAAALTEKQVEYMPGKSDWNKSRIQRIIDDPRYIGDGGYPPILTEQQHTDMQAMKSQKNTQKDMDHSDAIFALNAPVICHNCGSRMQRRHDKRRKALTWWHCSKCKTAVHISDNAMLDGIMQLLNTVIAAPEIIETPRSTYEESAEIKQMNAEISKALSGHDIDKEALKQKMLACASLKYSNIDAAEITAQSLKDIFKTTPPLTAYNSSLADQTVREIVPNGSNELCLILINGQRLGKEKQS